MLNPWFGYHENHDKIQAYDHFVCFCLLIQQVAIIYRAHFIVAKFL